LHSNKQKKLNINTSAENITVITLKQSERVSQTSWYYFFSIFMWYFFIFGKLYWGNQAFCCSNSPNWTVFHDWWNVACFLFTEMGGKTKQCSQNWHPQTWIFSAFNHFGSSASECCFI